MGFDDIIGQEEAVASLKAFGELYAASGGSPGHILIVGEDGMGKRRISGAFAEEQKMPVGFMNGASRRLEPAVSFLTGPEDRKILVLADAQRLRSPLKEVLYGALGRRRLGTLHDQRSRRMLSEESQRRISVSRDLRPFTLIATSPKRAGVSPEFLRAFALVVSLQPYSRTELSGIASKVAARMGVTIDPESCDLVAARCDGRPVQIEALLQQLARATNKAAITAEDTIRALRAFGLGVETARASDDPPDLSHLSGLDFERLIVGLLTRMGFRAEMTKATGDGGIDVMAVLDRPIVGGRYLFQCKRYAPDAPIGAPVIRDFYGAVTAERATKGIFITTSSFTTQAREFGDRAGLELIDLAQLRRLLAEHETGTPSA
jgi:Holliday junction resolvasome RuvABC ATP-dependent DNA helicase subunit